MAQEHTDEFIREKILDLIGVILRDEFPTLRSVSGVSLHVGWHLRKLHGVDLAPRSLEGRVRRALVKLTEDGSIAKVTGITRIGFGNASRIREEVTGG